MKQILSAITLTALLTVFTSGCSYNDQTAEQLLLGCWREANNREILVFSPENVVVAFVGDKVFPGTYKFDRDKLQMRFRNPMGLQVMTFEISSNTLILEDAKGRTSRYKRTGMPNE